MKSPGYLLLACCLIVGSMQGQSTAIDPDKKAMNALRIEVPPTLDGVLDDPIWLEALPAIGFVQNQPEPGIPAPDKSDVRVLYDNTGIYVGAQLYDTRPDSIQMELSERDDLPNADWFGVIIGAYRDGINGFGFLTTASNVQFDTKYSTFGEDSGWDAVWESKVALNSEGWALEMYIPFSALRFAEAEEQIWQLNFVRSVARSGSKSFWSEVDPQVDGFLNQAGYLYGIRNVKSPVRLQATPFVAAYGQQHHDKAADQVNTYGYSLSGGMDVKWGLSDAFTLDMTLIPDFGEAQSDNQVLNLSPFEVRFNENRPFFTEGTELFNKGGLFYSRRIGGRPLYANDIYNDYDDDQILSNPGQSQLYNATKVSGRTEKGLGVGLFNATSGRSYARVSDPELGEMNILTDPLTNYSVFVLDQNLPNNSYATLINTTVMREGDAYDANVTGMEFFIRNKSNSYAIGGSGALSQKYFSDRTDLGHKLSLRLRKTSGNLQAGLNYNEESDTYDPNDLGFLFNNNERSVSGFVEYNYYQPFLAFNRAGVGLYAEYEALYNPSVYSEWGINMWTWMQTKNFWHLNVWGFVSPSTEYDFFEPREVGRRWQRSPSGNIGGRIRTDARKRVRFVAGGGYWSAFQNEWTDWWAFAGVRFRVSNKFNLYTELNRSIANNDRGYVNNEWVEITDPNTGAITEQKEIYFGVRDWSTVESNLQANYTFNASMTLSFRLRHYWSTVSYKDFRLLDEDGLLVDTDYSGDHNGDFDAFNIDLIYRWRFAPGSDIFVVWKNNMREFDDIVATSYFRNLDNLFNAPQNNSLSVKVIYFLDYASLARR